MKAIWITIFCMGIAVTNVKGQMEIEWQRIIGGSSLDQIYSVAQTKDTGYVLIGYTLSNNGDISGNHGGYDILVVKLNQQGILEGTVCYGGSNQDQSTSIIQTSDTGFVFAGYSASNNGNVSGNHGYIDMWVARLNRWGYFIWQKCFGGTSSDGASSIIQTMDGGFIIAGFSNSNDGDVSGNHGNDDFLVLKISTQGNIEWQKCYGGSSIDVAHSIIQTNDSNYVIAGYTLSHDIDVVGNHGANDVWVIKINQQGDIIWQKCLGGTDSEITYSLIQTKDGGFILSGHTGSNDGDVSGNHGGYDAWIVKLDMLGNIEWQKCLGGTSDDFSDEVIQTADGGYAIGGSSHSSDGDLSTNIGNRDAWIIKLSPQGVIEWQKSMGGSGNDYATDIIQIANCDFVVSAWTESHDVDVAGNHGSGDLWIIKFKESNIRGIVFNDINANGIKDSLEQGVAGHLVRLMPGYQYTFTNNDGYYYFRGDTGITYTVKYIAQQYWFETTNNYYHYVTLDSLGQVVDTIDYAVNSRINVNDVSVYLTGSPTRTSSETHYWLTYKNWGTVTASGTIEFQYDPLLTYNASTPLVPVSHVGNTLTFAYDTLGPGVQRIMRVEFQVPGVQNLGDTLHSYAMITPLIPDTFVTNNYDTLQQIITGSYDPNDKSVCPAGYEQWGFVEHGQRLTYTIRFQNTGTDTAFTVVIRDTLDTDLDIETFVVEAYSHNVTWQLHSGNELFFTFQNILLPDSNVNEPESHGFIRYSISPKQGLADGTTATNTSYIFFDYNPAIVTNTTLNTFVTNIPVASPIREALKTLAFPNPSNDVVYINLPELTHKVEVYNLSGELVQQQVPQKHVTEIHVKEFPKGVYVVKLYSGKGVVTTRFVKE